MKILYALAASATLLLIAVLPAAAQPISLHAPGGAIQFAADDSFFVNKDAYVQRSKDEMLEWQRKMNGFAEKASTKGRDTGAAGMDGLRKAWSKAELEAHKLDAARADGWENAKRSFEEASQNLKNAWHDAHRE